jgi:hypothetical protein
VDVANPFGRISSPAVASFLQDVAELAEAPYSRRAAPPAEVDATASVHADADADQLTDTFSRSALPLEDLFADVSELETRVPIADDSEIEIVTGSFARISDLAISSPREESTGDVNENLNENLAGLRPSGFVMRAAGSGTARDAGPDDHETCRFARVAGDDTSDAEAANADRGQPRRGILPRRFSR